MAPKDAKKAKPPAATAPASKTSAKKTPVKVAAQPVASSSPSPTKARARPKVTKPDLHKLKAADNYSLPIDVLYSNVGLAAALDKSGEHVHNLTLKAGSMFSLGETCMITEGHYAGFQAILLKPAKPFNFMRLDKEDRVRVYRYYLAQKGVVNEPIVFDGKRANKEPYAKTFADGSKNRVGLVSACQEVHGEIRPLLYARTLRFESTTQLVEWMAQVNQPVRLMLRSIEVMMYTKTSSRLAFHLLTEARFLTRLYIDAGIATDADPIKAAKAFYSDAYKMLEAFGSTSRTRALTNVQPQIKTESQDYGIGDSIDITQPQDEVIATDGIDVLSFGAKAFVIKDAQAKASTPWSKELIDEFKESLRAKMK